MVVGQNFHRHIELSIVGICVCMRISLQIDLKLPLNWHFQNVGWTNWNTKQWNQFKMMRIQKKNNKNNTNEISFMRVFNTNLPEESESEWEEEEEEECHLNILNIFYFQWHSIFSGATIFISKKKKKRVRACNELTEREFSKKNETEKKTCSTANIYKRKVIWVMGDTQCGNENDRVRKKNWNIILRMWNWMNQNDDFGWSKRETEKKYERYSASIRNNTCCRCRCQCMWC